MKSVIIAAGVAWILGLAAMIAPAEILVSEIHYHPVEEPAFDSAGNPALDLGNDVHEFVELQNTGGASVDLGGWALTGGIAFEFPAGSSVGPGGFVVVAKNPARLATVYGLAAGTVLGPYEGTLGNSGDTVRVRDAAGKSQDTVKYESGFPWAQSADALGAQDRFTGLTAADHQYRGRSLQRVSTAWASDDPANWVASPLTGPSPGAAQAVTRAIPKPVVVAFSAVQEADGGFPVRAGQPVTVACAFSATNGLGQVVLESFVDDVNSTGETRASVVMTDLGGGRYRATLPGQAARAIVRYRFAADRGDGTETVSPRADDPAIVPSGAGGAREAWHAYFVTPVRTSSNAAVYDVLVSTTALATMAANISQSPSRVTAANAGGKPRDVPYVAATAPQWNGTVPGVFASGGQVWDIHIRYHGSRYHRAASNHSYKLHFSEHQPFNGETAWFETLHGTEFIEAQKLNRLLGLPASRMRRVDWYLNSGANEVHSEQGEYAGEMLDAFHELQQRLNPGSTKEATGELYKDVGNRDPSQNNSEGPYTRGDAAPLAANAGWTQLQRYEWTYSLQNHGWKGSQPIRDLLEGLWTARGDTPSTHNFASNAAQLASARAWFTNHWDLDTTLTSVALLQWMSIWDDAAQNHFFWRRADGRWVRLGWDYDSVMATTTSGGGGPGGGGGGGGLGGSATQTIYGGEYGAANVFDGVNWWKDTFYKCFRAEYQQRLWELSNSFLDPTNLTALGFSRAATFAKSRQTYINTQLAAFGTYTKPARPVHVSPPDGASLVAATQLVTGAYAHPQSMAHQATRWEIRAATGDYEEPVLRRTSTNDLTRLAIPFEDLDYGSTYYWRATYLDAAGHPSVVSAETRFTWGLAPGTTAGGVVLNEVLAFNRNAVGNGSEFPDYLELRNNGTAAADLATYSLGEDPLHPAKYTFPAGTTLAAGGRLVVWCDRDTDAPGLHAGFGLDAEGQTILLMNGSNVVDSVTFGPQAPDVSIGRIADGTGGWQACSPTPGAANTAVALGTVSDLRFNEWMADPAYGDDWFELHNPGPEVVPLAGLFLSDSPADPQVTQIPALSFIAPGGFTRFWADSRSAGGSHANFRLASEGDTLVLTAANGLSTIDSVTFGDQAKDVSEGRLPNGADTLVAFGSGTVSPGYGNWVPAAVRIHEVLANASAPLEDAVELENPTGQEVDITGWWLSDDLLQPRKYQFLASTVIPAGGFVVVHQGDLESGAVPFALNARGDEVVLSAVDAAGDLTGVASLVRFGASPENVSFGRVAATGLNASAGGAEFWPLRVPTFGAGLPASVAEFRTGGGASNAAPRIGPVVIHEIMHHPPNLGDGSNNEQDEYVELLNVSGSALDLTGWRLKGDSEYTFPAGTRLPAGGCLLLVGFDPADSSTLAAFRGTYRLGATVAVLGPYSEPLSNSTHDLEIASPDLVDGAVAYVLVDKVEYRDREPWPDGADGDGLALQRTSTSLIGNTAANWTAAAPTPGVAGPGTRPPVLDILVTADLRVVLQVTGEAGVAYTFESSADLVAWTGIGTTNSAAVPFTWMPGAAGAGGAFYRVRSDP